jgi:hypothetical protein
MEIPGTGIKVVNSNDQRIVAGKRYDLGIVPGETGYRSLKLDHHSTQTELLISQSIIIPLSDNPIGNQ